MPITQTQVMMLCNTAQTQLLSLCWSKNLTHYK